MGDSSRSDMMNLNEACPKINGFITLRAEMVRSYGVQRDRNIHPFAIKNEILVLYALGRENPRVFGRRNSLGKILSCQSCLHLPKKSPISRSVNRFGRVSTVNDT